ncbi:hypothetical protein BXZ70DRAFT_902800 [Cristinia sonorae]|uniref:Uncharacterized protein n=1 Tax=Cristinia sonorae TaxID=1940300 RepID=A0A8K0UE16_9AGAR|nr:hypothetical protein BXZ70DRAFT_902800 [Cristinia sonorae]
MSNNADNTTTDEERQRAIQKFMARAELSKLTRGLRARLSYATYKATHNLTHTTLNVLEELTEQRMAAAHGSPSKLPNNYYNNPATQGNSAMSSSAPLSRKGSMLPPTISASAGKSLFNSILAPPPAKRARTIHNPEDPPIVAPPKPKAAPTARKGGKQTRSTPAGSTKSKSRKDPKGKGKDTGGRASGHGLTPRSSFEDTNNDVDMKAAATLTSLLLSRPSLTASSPRSSLSGGSDTGSLHSFPHHYAQSSARTITAPTSVMPSHEPSFAAPYGRSSTPPPSLKRTHSLTQSSDVRFHSHSRSVPNAKVTPKTQSQPIIGSSSRTSDNPPTDTEAADLMLFLATSPSPVRPTTVKDRDARDLAAFRSLSGDPALQGRVLFPGSSSASGSTDNHPHLPPPQSRGKPLQRDGSGFSSTLSIATDASGETVYAGSSMYQKSFGAPFGSSSTAVGSPSLKLATSAASHSRHTSLDIPQMPMITPPTPTDQVPQNPSGMHHSLPRSPTRPSSRVSNSETSIPPAPPTPSSNVPFNLHDFLNVSPSPAALGTPQKTASNTSLRADVGRRLFEEHHAGMGHLGGSAHGHRHGQSGSGSGLGAGIDLVKS